MLPLIQTRLLYSLIWSLLELEDYFMHDLMFIAYLHVVKRCFDWVLLAISLLTSCPSNLVQCF